MASVDVLFVIDATGSMHNWIKAANEKAEDIAADLRFHHQRTKFRFGCVCYRDNVADSNDKNQSFDFDEEIENLSLFFEDVEAGCGGQDGPEDWVGALNDAFSLKWEAEKKIIIWLADASAHGARFGGGNKFPQEEAKLIPLVEKLATDGYIFTGIAIKKWANTTFQEMKKIYDAKGGVKFTIEEFNKEASNENIYDILTTTASTTVTDSLRYTDY